MLTINSIPKSLLLPSMITVLLALTACNDTSSVNDTEPTTTVGDATESTIAEPVANKELIAEPMTADEKMLETLSNYRWTLTSAADNKDQPIDALMQIKEQVTISFNQQGNQLLSYSVGCNTMSAAFELQANALTIEESMSTKMSCAELDAAENLLNQLIEGKSELTLASAANKEQSPLLTQLTSEMQTLVWSGRLTPQAKYNGKGETMFWAVAAKSIPCKDNNLQVCLQVKPVTYNEQGLKSSEGEYVEFAGTIDGYQHDGEHDEVLRLQRFKTNSDTVLVDNIDSEYAYVLDTVIESSVVKTKIAE